MAKFNLLENNFKSGLISPLLDGRTDIDEYKQGLSVLTNMYPIRQGGVRKRSGSQILFDYTTKFPAYKATATTQDSFGFIADTGGEAGNLLSITIPAENSDTMTTLAALTPTNDGIAAVSPGTDVPNENKTFAVGDITDLTDNINIPGHKFITGQEIEFDSTGVDPTNLNSGVSYYAIVVDADNIKPASTYQNAIESVAVNIAQGSGSGTLTFKTKAYTLTLSGGYESGAKARMFPYYVGSLKLMLIIGENKEMALMDVTGREPLDVTYQLDLANSVAVSDTYSMQSDQYGEELFFAQDGEPLVFYQVKSPETLAAGTVYKTAVAPIVITHTSGSEAETEIALTFNGTSDTVSAIVGVWNCANPEQLTISGGAGANIPFASTTTLKNGKDEGKIYRLNTLRRFTEDGQDELTESIFDRDYGICQPYTPENIRDTIDLNVTTFAKGDITTLTASVAFFEDSHTGAFFKLKIGASDGMVEVLDVASTTVATVRNVTTLPSAALTSLWQETIWKDTDWPVAVTNFEGRVIYAGSKSYPGRIWTSVVDDGVVFMNNKLIQDLASDVSKLGYSGAKVASDAKELGYTDSTKKKVVWLKEGRQLEIGTSGDTKVMHAEDGIGNSTASYTVESSRGSIAHHSVRRDDSTIYFDSRNEISELNLASQRNDKDRYIAKQLTTLTEGITSGTPWILTYDTHRWMAWVGYSDQVAKPNTFSLYGIVLDDFQETAAWCTFDFGDEIYTMGNFDEDSRTFLMAGRNNKAIVEMLEDTVTKPLDEASEGAFLDSFVAVTNTTPTTTFSGLDHLDTNTVTAVCDGIVYKGLVVTSGSITIPINFTSGYAGLPFTAELQTMRADGGVNIEGSSQGQTKRLDKTTVRMYNTKDISAGDPTNIYPVKFDDNTLYTGDKTVFVDQGPKTDNKIKIVSNGPAPMTITGIIHRGISYE